MASGFDRDGLRVYGSRRLSITEARQTEREVESIMAMKERQEDACDGNSKLLASRLSPHGCNVKVNKRKAAGRPAWICMYKRSAKGPACSLVACSLVAYRVPPNRAVSPMLRP
eukprot:gene20568-27364_t